MMNYILPIWKNHNQEKFNFYIFNTDSKKDITTQKIENLGFKILNCGEMDNHQIAKTIYDNEIDILVDLSGFTHTKSYCLFYKPAPIIMSYLGYLNTMGIKEVDYILANEFVIPKDKTHVYTEKPAYFKDNYHVIDLQNAPAVAENPPFVQNGYITFGSYNCTSKINGTILFLWSEILKRVPNSKLLIYRTKMAECTQARIKEILEGYGTDLSRVIFMSTEYSPHYKAYENSDILLDTYPFGGMSIAIENINMGVPNITLVGEGLQSRTVAEVNMALGLDEFNAYCGNEYIDIAVKLANNKEKLIELKKTLRERYNSSKLRDFANFTKDLERIYENVWEDFVKS